jgi:hypothetical protein
MTRRTNNYLFKELKDKLPAHYLKWEIDMPKYEEKLKFEFESKFYQTTRARVTTSTIPLILV